jgi:hypothetical protein
MDKDEIIKLMSGGDYTSPSRWASPLHLFEDEVTDLKAGKSVWVQQHFSRDGTNTPAQWLNRACQAYSARVMTISTAALPDGTVFLLAELTRNGASHDE